ncbi:hypothetical protein B0H14DRAFT_2565340 [Mycena olivaceomarginata]|nr:hypothetical protein B0H14DRAFT_2565340 [Mycena olivaceomarginata]
MPCWPTKSKILSETQYFFVVFHQLQPHYGPKHLRDITPEGVGLESLAEESGVEMLLSKGGKAPEEGENKGEGEEDARRQDPMGSLMREQHQSEGKLVAYKKEMVQAEAEMYHWLEQYERKHAELLHLNKRYCCDGKVWAGLAECEEGLNEVNSTSTYVCMEAVMCRRLAHNTEVIFKSADSGAHHDWVSTTSFDEMVGKIDKWREEVFKWIDDLGSTASHHTFVGCMPTLPWVRKLVRGVVKLLIVAQPPRLLC